MAAAGLGLGPTTAVDSHRAVVLQRAKAALQLVMVGDALSMPVHWFYNPSDIPRFFPPRGVTKMEAAPATHPSSIMNLHSTATGGRKGALPGSLSLPDIVGGVILKGKRQFWGQKNCHYHHGLPAGENTLNAYNARWMVTHLAAREGRYDGPTWLNEYIRNMTADPPVHPDTYAESYHRGFFANLQQGKAAAECGEVTHDTPSVGGLVTLGPLAISELLVDRNVPRVQQLCAQHLSYTHPDRTLTAVACSFVTLVDALLFRPATTTAAESGGGAGGQEKLLPMFSAAVAPFEVDLSELLGARADAEVVGGLFSTACYIRDSWPSLLYLAAKYRGDPAAGLMANTNLGGENCHRGSVLGLFLGLAHGSLGSAAALHDQLRHKAEIDAEIDEMLLRRATSSSTSPSSVAVPAAAEAGAAA